MSHLESVLVRCPNHLKLALFIEDELQLYSFPLSLRESERRKLFSFLFLFSQSSYSFSLYPHVMVTGEGRSVDRLVKSSLHTQISLVQSIPDSVLAVKVQCIKSKCWACMLFSRSNLIFSVTVEKNTSLNLPKLP